MKRRLKKRKVECAGCEGGYPRAWDMLTERKCHCNTGIYFPCTARDRFTPPPDLSRFSKAQRKQK